MGRAAPSWHDAGMRVPAESLENKIALVTGAGSGIGKATAKLLAYAGARVALVARTESDLQEVCDEIERGGGRALVCRG